MKELKKIMYLGLVIFTVALMCLQAGAINTTKQTIEKNNLTQTVASFLGNTLVSVDNPDGDDINPKIIKGQGGTIVVTYEQVVDIFSKVCPLVWSNDGGETWTTTCVFDSLIFDMSGILQSPDIAYNPNIDVFYFTAVDPLAEMYNNFMAFIPGDLNAEDIIPYAVSGSGSENYEEAACTCTDNFFMPSVVNDQGGDLIQIESIGYWTYPDFEQPGSIGWSYYDGQSLHQTSPCTNINLDKNDNRIFFVCETNGSSITIKSTVNDEALLDSGEQQNDMDKYPDVEQWPGEYIASGTDPDVSGSGDMVYVVYTEGGDVKCSYSSCDEGTYEPGFDWQTTTIASGAGFPAVHAMGDMVKVGYVKDNNVYLVQSDDGGATWGDPTQMNDEEGSVSAEFGAVDIHVLGIVWVDTRNGAKDIYTAAGGGAEIPILGVKSISKGMGVSAVIENTGTGDATDVSWSILIDAPLMILGGETSGTIDVPAGGEVTIKSGFVLGFGPAAISVKAGDASGSESGTVLLIFIL